MSDEVREMVDDEQLVRLLDEMADPSIEDPLEPLSAGGTEERVVRRDHIESLTRLPYALEPVEPSTGLKARVLEQLGSDGVVASERFAGERERALAPGSPRWFLPLAAALMIAMIGVTGWQVWRVEQQAATIARLSDELGKSRVATAELAAAREMVRETTARLEMLTAASAEFCALRPTVSCPNQQARGTIVMRADERDWFLRVEGLGPCEKGRQYKLWFVADGAPVLGASFAVEGSHELVEIRASGVPAGVKAVMITLEEPDVEAAPENPVLLYGDQAMRVL